MKIYRCIIGCLMAVFIAISVWYLYSCYDEQRSINGGILIREEEDKDAGYHIYQSKW